MKSIKLNLLNQLLDYSINNHPDPNNSQYVQAFKDLQIFLKCSNSSKDVKRFLEDKKKNQALRTGIINCSICREKTRYFNQLMICQKCLEALTKK